MADFDLTQTDQQVQNILNDAQGAMGASAQTTLTTEYVMLKDTSGIYHKILKSSFTEAIRDVLAGLLVNNDKGTTINQIAAIASGDFGSITPANLASVLGVPAVYGNPGTASGTILEYDGGYALIKVSDISSGRNALFLQAVDSAQNITMVAGDQSRFSTTKDTSSKINVYGVSENKFAVQQNTSASKSITVAIICARG